MQIQLMPVPQFCKIVGKRNGQKWLENGNWGRRVGVVTIDSDPLLSSCLFYCSLFAGNQSLIFVFWMTQNINDMIQTKLVLITHVTIQYPVAYTWTHPVEAIRDHARLPISKTQPSENNPGSVREMPRSLYQN